MKILVSLVSGSNNVERDVLRAFHSGILEYYSKKTGLPRNGKRPIERGLVKLYGLDIELSYDVEPKSCDIAIQFGSAKPREQEHHVVRQNLSKKAQNLIFIETPLLGRKIVDRTKHEYYRVGFNGFLQQSGIFVPDDKDLDPSRLNKFKEDFEIGFPGWKNHNEGAILILMQLPGDASLRGQDHAEWLVDVVEKIRKISDREIIIRLHPSTSDKSKRDLFAGLHSLFIQNYKNITWSQSWEVPLAEDFKKSGIAISYSSGSSIDAVLAGVPTISTDIGNMAYPVSGHLVEQITDPILPTAKQIDDWLLNLAYSQWNVEEMLSGRVWEHMLDIIHEEVGELEETPETHAEEISSDISPKHS